MSLHRSITLLMLLALCAHALPADEAPVTLEAGRYDVLLDLHGYNHAGSVVVQLAPLVHWLGAIVDDVGDWTGVARDGQTIYLQLPEGRPEGLGALVRVRDVVEALGGEVQFRAAGSPEAERLGFIPHVELIDGERTARVLLHAAPPPVAGAIIADVDRGDRCTNFLLHVSRVADDWAKTHEPQWSEQHGFTPHFVTGVLQRVQDRWQYAMRTTKISHTREELAEAGVPVEAALALGMEIED